MGQTVRMRFDDRDWWKREVTKVLPHRSYEIRTKVGPTLRRTSRQVHFFRGTVLQMKSEQEDDDKSERAEGVDKGEGDGSQERTRQPEQPHGASAQYTENQTKP